MANKKDFWGFVRGSVGPLVWSGGMVVAAYLATTVGILIGHAFHSRLVRDPIAWFDAHAGVAGWVQGVGSVVAIFAAIGIGLWQTNTVQTADRARRKTEAMIVAQSLHLILNDAHFFFNSLTRDWHKDQAGVFPAPNLPVIKRVLNYYKRPSEDQIMKLSAVDEDLAHDLVRTAMIVAKTSEMVGTYEEFCNPNAKNFSQERTNALLEKIHDGFQFANSKTSGHLVKIRRLIEGT